MRGQGRWPLVALTGSLLVSMLGCGSAQNATECAALTHAEWVSHGVAVENEGSGAHTVADLGAVTPTPGWYGAPSISCADSAFAVSGVSACTQVPNQAFADDHAQLTCTSSANSQVQACKLGYSLCESADDQGSASWGIVVNDCADGSAPDTEMDQCVLATNTVTAEITLDADLATINADLATFMAQFKSGVATALGVDASRVTVHSVAAGSVVVSFSVAPDVSGVGVDFTPLAQAGVAIGSYTSESVVTTIDVTVPPPSPPPDTRVCKPTLVPFSDRAPMDSACTGTVGSICNYTCHGSAEDQGEGGIVCLDTLVYSETTGCVSIVANLASLLTAAGTLVIVATIAAATAVSVGTAIAASLGPTAGSIEATSSAPPSAGFQGDILAVVFAVQFVAVAGQIAAPVGPVFRDFAASMSFALLHLSPPSFIANGNADDYESTGEMTWAEEGWDFVGRRRQLLFDNNNNETSTEEYLTSLGDSAADVFVGNCWYTCVLTVGSCIFYLLVAMTMKAVANMQIARIEDLNLRMKAATLPDDMIPPVPDEWTTPEELSLTKLLITLLLVSHAGLCQSSLNAIKDDSTPDAIFFVAVAVFVLFSLGFLGFVWFILLSQLPANDAISYTNYLPRMADIKARIAADGNELVDEDEAATAVEYLSNKMQTKTKNPDMLNSQGFWQSTDAEGARYFAIYGKVFSTVSDRGNILMGVELTKRVLTCILLVSLGDDTYKENHWTGEWQAIVQLLALIILTGGQLTYIVLGQVYIENFRNMSEPLVLGAQLATYVLPLLYLLLDQGFDDLLFDQGFAMMLLMLCAIGGIGVSLAKELLTTVPAFLLGFKNIFTNGPTYEQTIEEERDIAKRLLEANRFSPATLNLAAQVLDDEATSGITSQTDEIASYLTSYTKFCVRAAKDWVAANQDMVTKMQDAGEIDKLEVPVDAFQADGMASTADDWLTDCTGRKADDQLKKTAMGLSISRKVDIVVTRVKFSMLCEAWVMMLVRKNVYPLVQAKIDALSLDENGPKHQDIKELAFELCEMHSRRITNNVFRDTFNGLNERLDNIVRVGEAEEEEEKSNMAKRMAGGFKPSAIKARGKAAKVAAKDAKKKAKMMAKREKEEEAVEEVNPFAVRPIGSGPPKENKKLGDSDSTLSSDNANTFDVEDGAGGDETENPMSKDGKKKKFGKKGKKRQASDEKDAFDDMLGDLG